MVGWLAGFNVPGDRVLVQVPDLHVAHAYEVSSVLRAANGADEGELR